MAQLLRKGSQGSEVVTLQSSLSKLYPLDIPHLVKDGKFGPRTKEWVEKFQKNNDLAFDGVVGPKTWSKLKDKLPMTFGDPIAEEPFPKSKAQAFVYWCALPTRILRIGSTDYFNHSYLAIVTPDNHSFAVSARNLKPAGRYKYITLSITSGEMTLDPNDRLDSKAVENWLVLRNNISTMRFQVNEVSPPNASGVTFANKILQLARNYNAGKGPKELYWGPTLNCHSIVNSLLSAAGVSAGERSKCGNFVGLDPGNNTVVNPSYFR